MKIQRTESRAQGAQELAAFGASLTEVETAYVSQQQHRQVAASAVAEEAKAALDLMTVACCDALEKLEVAAKAAWELRADEADVGRVVLLDAAEEAKAVLATAQRKAEMLLERTNGSR